MENMTAVQVMDRGILDLQNGVHQFLSIVAIEMLVKNKVISGDELLNAIDERSAAMAESPSYSVTQRDAIKSEFASVRQIIEMANG